ncbi:hypothetical protein ACIPRI_26460 [Variovorax sp. LARHSF232]
MLPRLDIRHIGQGFFSYCVRAGQAATCQFEGGLDSLEGCLNDAGDSLGHYFSAVSVSLDGQELGSYAVQRLLKNPEGLAAELLDKACPPPERKFA